MLTKQMCHCLVCSTRYRVFLERSSINITPNPRNDASTPLVHGQSVIIVLKITLTIVLRT